MEIQYVVTPIKEEFVSIYQNYTNTCLLTYQPHFYGPVTKIHWEKYKKKKKEIDLQGIH